MADRTLTDEHRDSVGWEESRPCRECGELSEPGFYDVAFHDCDRGEWWFITYTVPESLWKTLPSNVRAAWPEDRVVRGA